MFSLGIIGPNCKLESCNVEKYQMYRVFQTYARLQNVFDGVEYQLTQNIELLSSAIKYIVLLYHILTSESNFCVSANSFQSYTSKILK